MCLGFRNGNGFGLPLYWFYLDSNTWQVETMNFLIDIGFFTVIYFLILLIVEYFNKDKKVIVRRGDSWKDSPYFVESKNR